MWSIFIRYISSKSTADNNYYYNQKFYLIKHSIPITNINDLDLVKCLNREIW